MAARTRHDFQEKKLKAKQQRKIKEIAERELKYKKQRQNRKIEAQKGGQEICLCGNTMNLKTIKQCNENRKSIKNDFGVFEEPPKIYQCDECELKLDESVKVWQCQISHNLHPVSCQKCKTLRNEMENRWDSPTVTKAKKTVNKKKKKKKKTPKANKTTVAQQTPIIQKPKVKNIKKKSAQVKGIKGLKGLQCVCGAVMQSKMVKQCKNPSAIKKCNECKKRVTKNILVWECSQFYDAHSVFCNQCKMDKKRKKKKKNMTKSNKSSTPSTKAKKAKKKKKTDKKLKKIIVHAKVSGPDVDDGNVAHKKTDPEPTMPQSIQLAANATEQTAAADIANADALRVQSEDNNDTRPSDGNGDNERLAEDQLRDKMQELLQKFNDLVQEKDALELKIKIDHTEEQEESKDSDSECKKTFKYWLGTMGDLCRYLRLFQEHQMDDVRYIEFLNENSLKDAGIKHPIHIQFMMKKINEFKIAQKEFGVILDRNRELKGLKAQFEVNGILTLDLLKNKMKQKSDLAKMLQLKPNDKKIDGIWNTLFCEQFPIPEIDGPNMTAYI